MRELYSLKRFDLPPELRLILSCLRLSPNDMEVQQIEKLSRTKIEWHNFLRWVDHHRVAPLVYTNLRRYAGKKAVPSFIMRGLRNRFERNAHHGLANASELVRLHRLLQENGIPVFPLKGSVLALQVYGNLALRHTGDIDLLVNPRHVDLADRLLRERYCRISPGLHLTPYQQKQYYRLRHLIYIHDSNNIRFELHTRLLYNRPYFALDLIQLQERARYIMVANASVQAMSPEDNLLYLCDHGAQHYWQRLFWLGDLAEIIRQDWVTDWNLLLTISTTLGVSRPLTQGVILAHLLFETPLPDQFRAYAAGDQWMPYLIKAALRRIITPMQDDIIETLYTNIIYLPKLYTDFNYKVECIKRLLFYSRDWGTFPLPDVLIPYFLILQPFMWFYRTLGRSQGELE